MFALEKKKMINSGVVGIPFISVCKDKHLKPGDPPFNLKE